MQSSFRVISLACAFAGTLGLLAGCSQGEGDRCEVDSDCSSGLICSPTGSPHNGVCRPISNPGAGGSTGQDAASPVATADAASDGPAVTADVGGGAAADAAAILDAAGADGGVDTPLEAEAVDSLSATD